VSLVLDLIFPKSCYLCHTNGCYLCPQCRRRFRPLPVDYPVNNRFEGILSLFRYHQAIKAMIRDLKFSFVTDLIPEICELIDTNLHTHYPRLLSYWQSQEFVLIPISLHSRRQSWRGFNQSEIICRRLSPLLGLKYDPDILIRHQNTVPQTSITNKSLRRCNLASSFRLLSDKYPRVILFDDVCTTTSTLISAASAFPLHVSLWGLTLAG